MGKNILVIQLLFCHFSESWNPDGDGVKAG
jgi:hypothetical protein